jgi:hypothetical protein
MPGESQLLPKCGSTSTEIHSESPMSAIVKATSPVAPARRLSAGPDRLYVAHGGAYVFPTAVNVQELLYGMHRPTNCELRGVYRGNGVLE